MSTIGTDQTNANLQERKARIIVMGAALGAFLGLISSYLYTRAAEENDGPNAGTAASISTGQLVALMLGILGVVRQIAELGRPKKADKGRKK